MSSAQGQHNTTHSLNILLTEPLHGPKVQASRLGGSIICLCSSVLLVREEERQMAARYQIEVRILARVFDDLHDFIDGVQLYIGLAQSLFGAVEMLLLNKVFMSDSGQMSSITS